MSNLAISIENLSKAYYIYRKQGGQGAFRYKTMQEDIMALPKRWLSVLRRQNVEERETVWALKDISFEVEEGEVVGIIGRNGAGKSTLLKILSRITDPTKGRAKIFGRIGSLLEVGTGFHPELTGRENIFLNGTILGMRRAEITRKFDEIVDFAEVERFIDTPVKFYSSGMYVRLAFSVAAHLELETLMIDEVLAVGDFEFQKKCIEKMKNLSSGGRTILFVSHNIGAIQSLCNRGIIIERGQNVLDDTAVNAVHYYLNNGLAQEGTRVWDIENAPSLDDAVKLRSIRVIDELGLPKMGFDVKETIIVEVEYWVLIEKYSLNVHLYFSNEASQTLFVSMDNLDSPYRNSIHPVGLYRARCVIPANFLNEGTIRIEYLICTRPTSLYHVTVPDAVSFQVTDDKSSTGVRGNWAREWPSSVLRPRLDWVIEQVDNR